MAWFGEVVEEEKSNGWSTESSRQKGQHALEKFGDSSVWTKPALQQDLWVQPAPGRDDSPVKKRENLKIENPSKISTDQTVFLFHILNIGKLYVFKETVNVLFHQLLNLWNEHCYTLQSGGLDTFTQVRERKRKKEKEGKRLFRDIFVNIAGILKRKEKRKKN